MQSLAHGHGAYSGRNQGVSLVCPSTQSGPGSNRDQGRDRATEAAPLEQEARSATFGAAKGMTWDSARLYPSGAAVWQNMKSYGADSAGQKGPWGPSCSMLTDLSTSRGAVF